MTLSSLESGVHETHEEKDLHRNLRSVRNNRTMLLHCSFVTQNQQLQQSFQTFAALFVHETGQSTSQVQPVLKEEMSGGSDRSRVYAKELLESFMFSVVSLDDSVIDFWMQATR